MPDVLGGIVADVFQEIVADEPAVFDRLQTVGALDRWIELWENVRDLAARADSVNLDRKLVILNAFAALESTARDP